MNNGIRSSSSSSSSSSRHGKRRRCPLRCAGGAAAAAAVFAASSQPHATHAFGTHARSIGLSRPAYQHCHRRRRHHRQHHMHENILTSPSLTLGVHAADAIPTDSTTIATIPPSSTSSSSSTRSIILVSLPPKTDAAPSCIRQVWKWKDAALGDGRDYFVPRPRALKAFNALLVGACCNCSGITDHISKTCVMMTEETMVKTTNEGNEKKYTVFAVEECGVLSNCARLDVLLVLSAPSSPNIEAASSSAAEAAARTLVAEALAQQLAPQNSGVWGGGNAIMDGLASFLDLKGVVNENPPPLSESASATEMATELKELLTTKEGGTDICRHLCQVAAGMGKRPSRPGRPVPFRPYSSRDAHVMLQIKRTAEVAMGSRVKTLLDASLQAGKACRDESKVPEIIPLKSYGTDGRYASEAPSHLTDAAVDAATRLAIDPAMERCQAKLIALESADAVSSLRQRVENEVIARGVDMNDNEKGLVVRRALHEPCMALREGRYFDVKEEDVLNQILDELGMC